LLEMYPVKDDPEAMEFCRRFVYDKTRLRFVMGRNEYAASIADCVDLDGFIDDFTDDKEFLGKPIYKTADVPKDSMVVSAVIFVLPLTALMKIKKCSLTALDYFKFFQYSGLPLKLVSYLEDGGKDIEANFEKYLWLYRNLCDDSSKKILAKLLNFRKSGDLNYMVGFDCLQEKQYFEKFLKWRSEEVFVDAGGFDGHTTLEFIRQCPAYKSIHFLNRMRKILNGHATICPHIKIFITIGWVWLRVKKRSDSVLAQDRPAN